MARAIPTNINQNQAGNQLIETAVTLIKQKKYPQAESRLATLRNQLPGNTRVMALYGDALRLQDRHDEAITEYERAFEAGLRAPELLLNLGNCYIKAMDGEKTMQMADLLLEKHPKSAMALSIKGHAHRLLKQPVLARDYLRQAIKIQPNFHGFYQGIAHLDTFTADSPAFDVLQKVIDNAAPDINPKDLANLHADLAKAYLDTDNLDKAFEHYVAANKLMDESLPPIQAELEKRLNFTRHFYTPSLYKTFSKHGAQDRHQIIIAGMSRSGKSLIESLFNGVDGVTLAGEEMVLVDFLKDITAPFNGKLDAWIAAQTPESIAQQSKDYIERLDAGDNIKITTIPGDLWNLGLIGLFQPNAPIIFAVRDVLDIGVTGFFQQYAMPLGYRYSYNLHQMGRQIACSEKVMEHWAQVLPNPVYLVDYEALTRDPQTVMSNLLDDLQLKRSQAYDEIVGENADFVDSLSPISSMDAPMPISDKFNGIGQKFIQHLQPMIDGYKTIVDQFPRQEPPATFAEPLPDVLIDNDCDGVNPSEEVDFNWEIPQQLVVLDNGAHLAKFKQLQELLNTQAFGIVVFDPAGDAEINEELKENPNLHYLPQTLLGDGQQKTLNLSVDAQYNSTLNTLPVDSIVPSLRQPSMRIAQLPISSVALDSINGIDHVDWLILDQYHDSISILENGANALKNTLLVHAMVTFQPTHENQANLAEISHWAALNGFSFHGFSAMKSIQAMHKRDDLVNQPSATMMQQAAMILVPDQARMGRLSDSEKLKLAFILDTVYKINDLSYELLNSIGESLGENYLKARGFFDRKRNGPSWKELSKIRTLINKGDNTQAGNRIRYYSRKFRKDPQLQRLQAEHASAMGSHQTAIAILNSAIKNAPEDLGIRTSAVQVLLRAGMWWEAQTTAQLLADNSPDNIKVMQLLWQSLAANVEPNRDLVNTAIEQIQTVLENEYADNSCNVDAVSSINGDVVTSDTNINDADSVDNATEVDENSTNNDDDSFNEKNVEKARLTASLARLLSHSGDNDAALYTHKKSLEILGNGVQGPLRADLLIEYAASLEQQGFIDDACDILWQACDTRQYSPYTVHAYRKFSNLLPKSKRDDLQSITPIHQEIQDILSSKVLEEKKDELKNAFGDYELLAQSFEPLKIAGTRPTMHRLEAYDLQELPANARALDISCNHGFLLMGLASRLSEGLGFDISQSCVDIGNAVAKHLDYDHVSLECKSFAEFRTRKKFDLVLACSVHKYIDMPLDKFGAKLFQFTSKDGILLLETQGTREQNATERDYEEKFKTIASAGFELLRKGSLCDDNINYREFWVLRRK